MPGAAQKEGQRVTCFVSCMFNEKKKKKKETTTTTKQNKQTKKKTPLNMSFLDQTFYDRNSNGVEQTSHVHAVGGPGVPGNAGIARFYHHTKKKEPEFRLFVNIDLFSYSAVDF